MDSTCARGRHGHSASQPLPTGRLGRAEDLRCNSTRADETGGALLPTGELHDGSKGLGADRATRIHQSRRTLAAALHRGLELFRTTGGSVPEEFLKGSPAPRSLELVHPAEIRWRSVFHNGGMTLKGRVWFRL